MALYQMRYRGQGEKPTDDIARMRAMPGVTVKNADLRFTVILDVSSDLAVHRLKKMANWEMFASQTVTVDLWATPEIASKPHLRLVPPPAPAKPE